MSLASMSGIAYDVTVPPLRRQLPETQARSVGHAMRAKRIPHPTKPPRVRRRPR